MSDRSPAGLTAAAATPEPHELERLTVYVPRGLRRAVKIAAAVDSTTASAWATAALTAALPAFITAAE